MKIMPTKEEVLEGYYQIWEDTIKGFRKIPDLRKL